MLGIVGRAVRRSSASGAAAPQINHGRDDVAPNLLRFLGHGLTLVTGPAGEVLGFADRRLAVVLILTVRDTLVAKIEATVDPSAARTA